MYEELSWYSDLLRLGWLGSQKGQEIFSENHPDQL